MTGPGIHPTWGMIYWPAYLLIVAIGFMPAEIIALITNPQNTLSDFAWKEFGFPRFGGPSPALYTAAWYFSLAGFLMVVVFLVIHIWFEKLR